jgi:hypothetical protein
MEDTGSDLTKHCGTCGTPSQSEECVHPDCPGVTRACACGEATPCGKEECVLSHVQVSTICSGCRQEIEAGETCDRADCPRTAAALIQKASIDTPFKLGL